MNYEFVFKVCQLDCINFFWLRKIHQSSAILFLVWSNRKYCSMFFSSVTCSKKQREREIERARQDLSGAVNIRLKPVVWRIGISNIRFWSHLRWYLPFSKHKEDFLGTSTSPLDRAHRDLPRAKVIRLGDSCLANRHGKHRIRLLTYPTFKININIF